MEEVVTNPEVGTEVTTEETPVSVEEIANDLSGGTEEVVVDTPTENETVVENEIQETEEEEIFDPENINFEEAQYNVDGYDLSKYKESLDFDNPENMEIINAEIKKLKEKGYSQKEAEIYIDAKLEVMNEYEADITPEPVTRAEVTKILTESLNKEERANYKPILNSLKADAESLGLTPSQVNDAMSNPLLVKIMNSFYKKAANAGSVKTAEVKAPEPRVSVDFGTAFKKVQNKIVEGASQADVIKFAKELEPSLKEDQLDQFRTTIKRVFNIKD